MKERYCDKKELELYFHIPFCVRKCFYCDFLSAPGDEKTKRDYMEALLAETVGSAVRYTDYEVVSIFIGGGTPSTVPAECLEQLMEAVRTHYRLAQGAEVTIEVNPGTVSEEALLRFRRTGINRLSIGLQSSDDAQLKAIGRIHTWGQFMESYAAARRAGFENVNVDIMSALPGQTLSAYRDTLRKILLLDPPPEHISAYSLILEEGTYLYERYERGELELPDEDADREMYRETKEILAGAGYERYEISNYAKKGYACRHNCGYWKRKNYAGFGVGAASLVENIRFRNGVDLKAYLEEPQGCREDVRSLEEQEQMEEFLFLGLRMTEGISCGEFSELFGRSLEEVYGEVIRKNIREGLLRYRPGQEDARRSAHCKADGRYTDSGQDAEPTDAGEYAGKESLLKEGGRLALTDKGLDVSNYVMAQFLLD